MTRIVRLLFPIVVVASLAIGCAQASLPPTSPSSVGRSQALASEDLAGTWILLSVQPAGQPDQAAPAAASYTLTFADGRLSTRADCNTCSGTFSVSGQTLTAGPALACTRAACPTMEFESAYTSMLSGDSTVTLSDDSLVLSSPRGVLRFHR